MENFRNKSFFWTFIIIWGGLIIWNLFTPAREFSESENRFLKVFPKFSVNTLLNGKFMEDVNVYLNDHFAGRPYWVSLQGMIEYGTGKREINGVYIGKVRGDVLSGHSDAAFPPDSGKTALLGDVAPPDTDLTEKNIAGINVFQSRYDIPIYVMLIPSSTEIQKQNLPTFAAGWDEKAYIEKVYAGFGVGITPVDVYGALNAHKGGYIYYRTDHHWTSYGAYIAYKELARWPIGLTASEPADFKVTGVNNDFYGTFHSKTGFPLAVPDIMEVYQRGTVESFEIYDGKETTTRDSIYFDEFLNKKDKYSYFLGQVQPIVTIKTESDSGRKLLIFKDSYAHCLVPMMLADFSEIRLVDLRFANPLTIGEQLEAENYDEALFIYCTDVFSHQLGAGILRT